ncbi:MAG: type II toxin-antitoxin system VapC family toxin [Acidimicrobiales bacterium]|jgi:hypothetical protein
MTRGLADTSVFVARESGRALQVDLLPDELALSVVTAGELRAGVLSARDLDARDQRLRTLSWVMGLEVVPVDLAVADAWARLRVELRDRGLRMPVNGAWIAATAIALDVPLVTQDDDHVEVSGLRIIRV